MLGLFWRGTWFGIRLSDDELIESMSAKAKPRDVQHGIEEITRRYDERSVGMDRWAKLLVESSRRPEDPVRVVAAWGMGYDARRPEFAARLEEIVASDSSVLARRNAALSLARGGDPAGRAVLRSMLEPFTVTAPVAGVVGTPAPLDAVVRENARVVGITGADGTEVDVAAPVPGRVFKQCAAPGARVAIGDAVVVLSPDALHATQAALALSIVGTADDVEVLALAAGPQSSLPDDAKASARAAADAIRSRGR